MHELIKAGLTTLVAKDKYLLINNINERSITHKLGMYYQAIFPQWDVDCEYNRNLGNSKQILIEPKIFISKMIGLLESNRKLSNNNLILALQEERITAEDFANLREQLQEPERLIFNRDLDVVYFVLKLRDGNNLVKNIYPDIIIHERGSKKNLLAIEAKKSSNSDPVSRAYDIVKLTTLVSDKSYKYKRGYFIEIPTGCDFGHYRRFIISKENFCKKVYLVKPSSKW